MGAEMSSIDVTAALLRGALDSAMGSCPMPEIPPVDLPNYILGLCRAYRTTGATPRNMDRAADQLEQIGDRHTASFARRKAREERGHDLLAMKDLMSLGLPRTLPHLVIPTSGAALVDLFDRLASHPRPYGVFGYAYALEAVSAQLPRGHVARVQRLVPPGVDITRCLRCHADNDPSHVRGIVDYVAGFGQAEREQVIDAIQEAAVHLVAGIADPENLAKLTEYLAAIGWTAPAQQEAA